MPECCGGCVYFRPVWPADQSLRALASPRACRRHAPAPDPLLFGSRWPLVEPGDWCGDFQAKSQVEVCRCCGAPLLDHEIRASAAGADKERHGSSLCDLCFRKQKERQL